MKNKCYLLIFGVFILFAFSNCSRTNADKFANQSKVEEPVRDMPASVEAEAKATNSGATKRAVKSSELSPEVKAIKDRKMQNNNIRLKQGMEIENKKQKKGN